MPDDKEDEELSLDLGGLKKVFGKEKKTPEKKEEEKKSDDDKEAKEQREIKASSEEKEAKEEEIKIDLGGIFRKSKEDKKEKAVKEKDEGEDISFDAKAAGRFFSKYWFIVLLIIPVVLSMHLRMQAAEAPFTDEWAKSSVFNFYKTNIRAQIDQQYPNLPDANKNALVEEEFRKLYGQQKDMINQQVSQASQYFKDSFRDDKGRFYMPDIDPYYWYRYASNIVEKGAPGDEIRNGEQWDNHQLAPNGRPIASQDMFHPYFLAYFFNVMKIFNGSPDFGVFQSMFYYPVFISALVVVFVFLIARRIAGDIAGFFAATMVAISSALANRTLFGHADSDAWVVFFPVLVTWLFLEAIEAEKTRNKIIFASFAGFFTGVFSLAWGGWWYIFDFLLGAAGIAILVMLIMNYREITSFKVLKKPEIKSILIVLGVFLLFSGIFISIFSGPRQFLLTPVSSIGFTEIKTPVLGTLWPNVLRTVAELNPGSIDAAIASVGGMLLFAIALAGIVLAAVKKNKFGKIDVTVAALLAIWFIGTIYATTKGIRFTLLLVPAFSIAFGIGVGIMHDYLTRWGSRGLHINKLIVSILVLGVFFMLFFTPRNLFEESYAVAQHDVPIINDAWYNSLTAIKSNSSQNAIITSWWDFGHHFKALADRPVTFDGTTQDSPQAHWVGKILLTKDEKEAVGILRMLDCGGNNAFDELFKINNDTHSSVDLLYKIIVKDRENAKSDLVASGLSDSQAENVLKYTHCNPPEGFFIASEDMIGKAGVWAHFGGWDFEKAEIWRSLKKMPKDEAVDYMVKNFGYTQQKAENLYFDAQAITDDSQADAWISPWPGYGGENSCTREDQILKCSNGIDVNLTSKDAYLEAPQGRMHPSVFAYPQGDEFKVRRYDSGVLPQDIGVTLIPEGTSSYSILVSGSPLAGSMFTRMFYLKGYGLRYFKPFTHETSVTGTDIYVYKMDWEGSSPNINPELNIENEESAG